MKLTPELILGFSEAYLRDKYDDPKPTPQFHIDQWTLMCREDQHVAAAAPRGHAKSTAVTHAFGLAALLFGWKSHLLIVSGTGGQASAFLKNMASELTNNDELIKDFKTPVLLKRSCFACESTLKASFMDGVKVMYKMLKGKKSDTKYGVVYGNGIFKKGWV